MLLVWLSDMQPATPNAAKCFHLDAAYFLQHCILVAHPVGAFIRYFVEKIVKIRREMLLR